MATHRAVRARARAICALVVGGVVLVGGCTATAPVDRTPSGSGPVRGTDPVRPLTPSVPDAFRTGTNACGNPYAVNATSAAGTIPLLDCPGLAGLRPTPRLAVRVGGDVTVSGLPATASISIEPAGLLDVHGATLVVVRPGRTVVTVHGYLCVPPPGRPQPSTCALLALDGG